MKKIFWLVAILLTSSSVLAACGGGSSSSSSNQTAEETTQAATEETSGGNEEATEVEPPVTDPEVPTNPITTPLPETPPTGKKVVFLQCELPTCAVFVKPLEAATKALGWSLESLVFSSADPGKGMETALQKNPDFIALTGIPQAVIKPQMATAEKRGIPVVSCATVEQGKPGGFTSQCESTAEPMTEELGKWIIQDSGSQAHVLGATLPIFPILGTQIEYWEGEFLKTCSGCSYETLELTPEDIGEGKVGTKVVAAIQQNPEINYVFAAFSDVSTGLRNVLDSAGLSNVKIVTASGNAPVVQEVPEGIAATFSPPQGWMSWQMVDAMARTSVGEDVQSDPKYQELIAPNPMYVIDSKEGAERLKGSGYEWPGPGDGAFEEEFEELWQVK